MKIFSTVTVGLALSESDSHLLSYARRLCELEIAESFRFVHAVERHSPESVDSSGLCSRMEQEVQQVFGERFARQLRSFEVRRGNRLDEFVADLGAHPAELVLLGHRPSRGGRKTLASRLAMISPASIWMVPDGAALRIEKILAPIDFSVASSEGLALACRIAAQAGVAECEALHVYFDTSTIRYAEHVAELKSAEQQSFATFLGRIETGGVNVRPRFEESSHVAGTILRVAHESQSDLIVMSTRGRTAAAAILLGSEVAQTLRDAAIPVLVLKHHGAYQTVMEVLRSPELWRQPMPKAN